jgi:hypothetical protein
LAHLTPFAAQPTRRVVPTDGPNGAVAVVVNKSPLSLVDSPHCQSRLQHRSLGRAHDTGSPLTGAVSRWPELLLLRARLCVLAVAVSRMRVLVRGIRCLVLPQPQRSCGLRTGLGKKSLDYRRRRWGLLQRAPTYADGIGCISSAPLGALTHQTNPSRAPP